MCLCITGSIVCAGSPMCLCITRKYCLGWVSNVFVYYREVLHVLGLQCVCILQGSIVCAGSPMYLKKQFGSGYHMTVAKQMVSVRSVTVYWTQVWQHVWILQDLTGLPSTSLAWGRGWHQDMAAQGLSSVLVYSTNLTSLFSTQSTTCSRLFLKKYSSILFLNIFTLVALMHFSGYLIQSFTTLWEKVYFLISGVAFY